MNILIMNRQYDGIFGGVELMSTALANEMNARGHNVHIVSLDMPDAKMRYDLNDSIQWHKISTVPAAKKASWLERLQRFKKIRNIAQSNNIDVAIGFQDGAFLSLALALLKTDIPVIAAERNSPSRFEFTKEGKYQNLRYQSFRLAKNVTVQCDSYIKKYPAYLREKIVPISNPVFPVKKKSDPKGKKAKEKIILSVGRASYQKNYEVLVRAFSKISSKYPDWKLVLVGDGDRLEKLKFMAKGCAIEFAGYQKDPAPYYAEAQIFCLPSLWEGFPNALAEAMSHGLSCVGFKGCDGINDLIEDGKTGYLAAGNDNAESLAEALDTMISEDEKWQEMGDAGRKKISQYTPELIYDKWEALFKEIAEKK